MNSKDEIYMKNKSNSIDEKGFFLAIVVLQSFDKNIKRNFSRAITGTRKLL